MTKRVEYKDPEGRQFLVALPEDVPDSRAHMGARLGPPDLGSLGLPLELEVRLNNQLFGRGLFTERDARKRPQEVFAALQATFRVATSSVLNLYRSKEAS